MKRILIFSMSYHPFIGGAEIAIKEITDRLPTDEYEFHMVTLRYNSELPVKEKIGNITVHRIGLTRRGATTETLRKFPLHVNKYLYQFYAPWYAAQLHKAQPFDLQWAMMAHACGVPAALFDLTHPRVRYLLTLQEGDPPEVVERLARPVWPLFARAFYAADGIQAISTFLMQWARRRGFTGKGWVVPNGVDVARFTTPVSPESRAAYATSLGKKEGEVYLVTTSRLVAKNGIDDVIRSLPLLPAPVSFIVYGVGPDEEKLRSLARSLHVEERVRFMGQISHSELPTALSACDIFIRPSRSEGMGNSFIEAMAAGLPVIATQEGGISDFLFDRVRNPDKPTTGWAVGVNAPEDIARAVEEICADRTFVQTVCAQARDLVIREYDWNLVARKMNEIFTTLI